MSTRIPVCLAVSIPLTPLAPAWAATDQAANLRSAHGLPELTPTEAFLSGSFVADAIDPTHIFGKVKDFAQSLASLQVLAIARLCAKHPTPVVKHGGTDWGGR